MSAIRKVVVSAALALGVVLGAASAAEAHAVLLRSDPSPQSTVQRPPPAIRLEFSEPVEVAFGAVQVFDVDGRRVDGGSLRRYDGNRTVSLPVPALVDGTYTVTWRVASADGHAVSGGFQFYVGAPSAISPVPVPLDQSAGTGLRWGFGVVRALWLASLIAAVGLVVVRRWVWTPSIRAAGLLRSPAADSFRRGFRVALPAAWVVLVVTAMAWLVLEGATLSGLSAVSAARPSVVGEVLRTGFGRFWAAGIILSLVGIVPVVALTRRRALFGLRPDAWIALLALVAAGMALSSALSGHARTDALPGLTVPSVAGHLLAVGVWVGGLGALVVLGAAAWRRLAPEQRPDLLRRLVPRFSRLAIAAVGLVVVTGTVNALASLGPVSNLWEVAYGRVLSAKIILLAVALVLAARHLWVTPRRLAHADSAPRSVRSFRRSATAELVVLVGAVGLAAALVALVPGRTLAQAAQGPVNRQQAVGDYTAQLVIDPSAVGANQVHVTFVNAQGLGAAEVTNVAVTLAAAGGAPQPVDMRLISPGHFVGEATMPVPGRYRLTVRMGAAPTSPSATFEFRISDTDRGQ